MKARTNFTEGVAPFTGAWIEIQQAPHGSAMPLWSHPSRVRGLKYPGGDAFALGRRVAPFTGAWIEI